MSKPKDHTTGQITMIEPTNTALTAMQADFAADSGQGMEGVTQDALAIPFLAVLQKGSPQVDEASGAAIDGAKSGMFYNTVTGQLMEGKTGGALLVPCAFRRVFIRWAGEGQSQNFKGELTVEEVAEMRSKGQVVELENRLYAPNPDGTVHEKKSDRFSDARNHYCLLIDEATGSYSPVLLSLSSTQIKKSKMLMSLLAGVKLKGAQGFYTPPTFANQVRVTTVPESNDKGSWHGVRFELAGQVATQDVYAAAKAFHHSVVKGAVTANYDAAAQGDEAPAATASGF